MLPVDDAVVDAPRLNVGGKVFPLPTDEVSPGTMVAAAAAAVMSERMRVAVGLTPGRPVPDGMVTMLEVEAASRTACATAISLFSI